MPHVIFLSEKDVTIMKGMQTLREMDDKIEPLFRLRDILVQVVAQAIFNDEKNGEYTIDLDGDHKAVFTIKDGEFDYNFVCLHEGCGDDAGPMAH